MTPTPPEQVETTPDAAELAALAEGITPGEWLQGTGGGGGATTYVYSVRDGKQYSAIAGCTHDHVTRPFAEREANARAIAAVPRLFALIEHLTAKLSASEAAVERLRQSNGYDIPAWSTRQAKSYEHTALDKLFANAVREIETWGAHPDLTNAQSLVGRAWAFINRWIEADALGASEAARTAIARQEPEGSKL